MFFRCSRLAIASFVLGLLLAACGGGGGGGSAVPTVSNPNAQPGGTFMVDGFTAKFTEYPLPPGVSPRDITVGPDGAVWFGIASLSSNLIGRATAGGAITLFPIQSPFENAGDGVIASDAGALWTVVQTISPPNDDFMARITPQGAVSRFGLGISLTAVGSIIVGFDRNVWFAEDGVVNAMTTSGALYPPPLPIGLVPGLWESQRLTTGPDGNYYVTASNIGPIPPTDSAVFKVSPTGSLVQEFPFPNGSRPTGIVTGPDGNLWIAEAGANHIARMTTSGATTEFTPPTPNAGPQLIIRGTDGALWFTEDPGNNIGRITTAGSIAEFPIPTAGSHAFGITTCPVKCENAHGRIWFTEGVGKIAKFEF